MKGLVRLFLALSLLVFLISCSKGNSPSSNPNPKPSSASIPQFQWIKDMMDKYHKTFDVYTDVGSGGNHFPVMAKMEAEYNKFYDKHYCKLLMEVDQCETKIPQPHHNSATCIKVVFKPQDYSYLAIRWPRLYKVLTTIFFTKYWGWGGFYFMNGVFPTDAKEPQQNWGDYPNAGFNLTGATKLTFFARGEKGGEQVEFFVGGTGWPDKPYKESLPKVPCAPKMFSNAKTAMVTLSREWRQYTIDLKGKDLSYLLSGFGWIVNGKWNHIKPNEELTFYLDDIRFDLERPDELRFIQSYETQPTQQNDFDVVMRNVAFTYDNALALLAFLARGTPDDLRRAKILADGFVYASQNDRFYNDGRLRNAYSSGDLKSFPGWKPNNKEGSARLPGFWNCTEKKWFEDKFSVSTHTGNVAWAMIAMISAYERFKKAEYLSTAERLGEWVEQNLKDNRGAGGYLGGFDGWEPDPQKLFYKSTEHNLDLYVAFIRLYELTKNTKWKERALHARKFVLAMWDEKEDKFWTGTKLDGVTINKDVIPLDVQAWAILVFRDEAQSYIRALRYAEGHHADGDGFDFNTDKDGIWYEGTAQMAVAYQVVGEKEKAQNLLKTIKEAQLSAGAIPAASKDGLTTGFDWQYFHRGHLGATAWYLFAKLGVNPYWVK